jgi:exopolysaccharide biosynthesis polyprenyl glycosylphosphotransferase
MCNSPRLGKVVVGFVDDDPRKAGAVHCSSSFSNLECTAPVLGTRKDIGKLIEDYRIDEIYLAISNIDNSTCAEILNFLKRFNVRTRFVPNLYKLFMHRVRMGHIGQIPVVEELDPNPPASYLKVKRAFDAVISAAALMLLTPLFAVIGAAIKLDTRGPVFFRQKRVGMNGRIFEIYKFRSMRTDADPYAVNPLDPNDTRITRVGRFLRKTSLDELPQLINVLKGDMSLVGPRPEMPFIVETYNEIHRERLKVLPGITGLWQLSGDRKRAIHENMDYDLYYIRNMSFSLDVAILLQTLLFAFRGI